MSCQSTPDRNLISATSSVQPSSAAYQCPSVQPHQRT
ncbi:unnamed protein product, partial [Staurois parvus]